MTLNVSFKNMDSSDSLRNYAMEKSERLGKYFRGKITVAWNFTIEKQFRVIRCHLIGNHMDYYAETHTEDFFAGIDMTVEKVEKQLKKHKEIVKDHLHRNGRRAVA